MIDLNLLRENPQKIIAQIHKKDPDYDAQKLFDLDKQLRDIKNSVEDLRHKKNELAKAARGGITDELRNESIAVGKQLKEQEQVLSDLEQTFKNHYLSCPNIPYDSVPVGGKENNTSVREHGTKPSFSFDVKNHVELGEALGWLDFKAATKVAGANFALYKGKAVKLMYALTMFMIKNNLKHGFELVLPPYLVNEQSLTVTGNFPKFKEEAFAVPEDKLFLTPTAEVNLTNMYRDHIFMRDELPVRMTAWTSCFRREAGGYGATERGLIRMHQFEKVELVSLCEPEKSETEQERMLACAEDILQQLGLHYRVMLLAAQDCSFASAKTYDIEVWLPGQDSYYEVSSISNCTDFQARRGLLRYKEAVDSKTDLIHTLNGSSIALSRLMVAIMENFQQVDGSIAIPKALLKEGLFE